ncbi:hypothetical protein [Azorhizobium oxalatiphilum]|uniref:hypothetical protein n=1 Tax=Azorhizobium oxalatiphilum TaxID=980631 RepID=UPI001663467B|nr:hypothetical protein [Azorhizobium oxalatiphilum]
MDGTMPLQPPRGLDLFTGMDKNFLWKNYSMQCSETIPRRTDLGRPVAHKTNIFNMLKFIWFFRTAKSCPASVFALTPSFTRGYEFVLEYEQCLRK